MTITGSVGDLTTLANVKSWRSPVITTSVDDSILARAITATSAAVLNYLNRTLIAQTAVEVRDGTGQRELSLFGFPVVSVSAVNISGSVVPAAPDAMSDGFIFNPKLGILKLRGWWFDRGFSNISVTYLAGYMVQNEAQIVSSGSPYAIPCSSLKRLWAADNGVSYAGGAALSPVAASPAVGQYIAPLAPDDAYTFNIGDANKAMSVSYSFTPKDIEQATILWILSDFNTRPVIGVKAKSLAGESITYDVGNIPASVKEMLSSYQQVFPII